MLKPQLFREVVALINDLQHVESPEQFLDEILCSLEKLFDASDSVILDWTPFVAGARNMSKDDMFFHKFRKQPGWDYPQVHHEDPIYDWIESGRCHADFNAVRLSDLASFRDVRKSRFYSEILVPLKCRYVLTMAAHRGDDIEASISMIRPPGARNFTEADLQLARLITPVLANAYSHVLLKRKSALNEDIFEIVASQLRDKPYIIFSSGLESVYRSDQMTLLGRQLRNVGDSISDIFSRSEPIAEYIEKFTSTSPALRKRLPGKLTDTVNMSRRKFVQIELQSFFLTPEKRYLMATLGLGNADGQRNRLQSDFGLTMREDQIAQLAARGLSSPQIGRELAISPWSVKNHLKNIYKKTGINNRASLAQLAN